MGNKNKLLVLKIPISGAVTIYNHFENINTEDIKNPNLADCMHGTIAIEDTAFPSSSLLVFSPVVPSTRFTTLLATVVVGVLEVDMEATVGVALSDFWLSRSMMSAFSRGQLPSPSCCSIAISSSVAPMACCNSCRPPAGSTSAVPD